MKKKILFAAAALTLLTACTDDVITTERVPVRLTYTALDAVETRAAQNLNEGEFATGEAVMVRISNTGQGEWTDYTFTTAAEGVLTAPNPAPYYPAGTQNIDIAAYYPATAGTEFSVATDQRPDASYKASDLMFASVTNQAKQAAPVNLLFSHKMAKLCLNITAGEGVESITSVSVLQVKPTVTFNQATGTVGAASGDAATIAVSNQGAAVIPAQTITGGLLSIETPQGTATYSVPNGKAFEAGHLYTMNITVNLRAVGATTDITDWISEGTLTVNPVEIFYEPSGIELRQTELVMRVGTQENLIWNLIPFFASRRNIRWLIDNQWADLLPPEEQENLAAWISPEGLVTAKKPGTTTISAQIEYLVNNTATTYQCWSEECTVTVVDNFNSYAVDLGLSVKWASCNIGTSTPEGFGNFYAWGETKTKLAFWWGNYPHCGNPNPPDTIHWQYGDNGPNLAISKYNTQEDWHFTGGDGPDGKTVLEPVDDVATAQWGEGWRMPTKAEWEELLDGTTQEMVIEGEDEKGFRGLRLTSKTNGNSIFLPAAGSYTGTQHDFYYNSGNDPQVEYWSSSLDEEYPFAACVFYIDNIFKEYSVSGYTDFNITGSVTDRIYRARNEGRPVRAVYVGD